MISKAMIRELCRQVRTTTGVQQRLNIAALHSLIRAYLEQRNGHRQQSAA